MKIINDFINEIKAEQALVMESMVTGNFANFESYQRYVGRYQGLEEALNILNYLLEEKEKDVA
jgi:hypothetical protein